MSQLISLDIQSKKLAVKIGQLGEEIAAAFLLENNYRLVAANFKIPIGRNRVGAVVTGEIDLVGFDETTLCFVEVKTRTSEDFASPLAAINLRKQRQIIRTAKMYRKIFRLTNTSYRYDAVSIILNEPARPKIQLFKGYWNESNFSNKTWNEN